MNDWFDDKDTLWAFAWDQIVLRKDARLWAMATVADAGTPMVRTVVLRGADTSRHAVQFHTDTRSTKVHELTANPSVGLMCWLPASNLQIRCEAQVGVKTGATVADIWADVPAPSRKGYGTQPTPSTPIVSALDYAKPADQAGFAVLDCTITKVDLLHLGPDHRRATYARNGDWIGQWVAP